MGAYFLEWRWISTIYVHTWQREKALAFFLFFKDTNLLMGISLSGSNDLPKALLPIVTLGLQHMSLGGHSKSIAGVIKHLSDGDICADKRKTGGS